MGVLSVSCQWVQPELNIPLRAVSFRMCWGICFLVMQKLHTMQGPPLHFHRSFQGCEREGAVLMPAETMWLESVLSG